MNTFEEHFKRVDESRQLARTVNQKLIESVLEIGNAQKTFYARQRALAESEVEIAQLKSVNKEAKIILMKALIERDEYLTKKSALKTANERLMIQNENLHREIDHQLHGEEVDSICEKFSFSYQISLLKDMQDARCKLLKYGFLLSSFP